MCHQPLACNHWTMHAPEVGTTCKTTATQTPGPNQTQKRSCTPQYRSHVLNALAQLWKRPSKQTETNEADEFSNTIRCRSPIWWNNKQKTTPWMHNRWCCGDWIAGGEGWTLCFWWTNWKTNIEFQQASQSKLDGRQICKTKMKNICVLHGCYEKIIECLHPRGDNAKTHPRRAFELCIASRIAPTCTQTKQTRDTLQHVHFRTNPGIHAFKKENKSR